MSTYFRNYYQRPNYQAVCAQGLLTLWTFCIKSVSLRIVNAASLVCRPTCELKSIKLSGETT